MIYELSDMTKAYGLFAGWEETMIYSCLQQIMGKVYVTDTEHPLSASAVIGCFAFFAGVPDAELLEKIPAGEAILVPQNQRWAAVIERKFPEAERTSRYATRKDIGFSPERLRRLAGNVPEGYEIRKIDGTLYDLALQGPYTRDFAAGFSSKEQYLAIGLGFAAVKDGKIAAVASSFSRFGKGIEIEVDTVPEERRKHLAAACCASLMLECFSCGLYPSWDAATLISVKLAEKLGYHYSHDYFAYLIHG